jgi:hypothetical protein
MQQTILWWPKLLLASCLILSAPANSAQALDLDSILDAVSITPPDRVSFREIRHNKMLKEELVISGYLEYLGEGKLRKVVEYPFAETFQVEAGQIQVERGGETKILPAKHNRGFSVMLNGIEAIISGQSERLTSDFNYELAGTEDAWVLLLMPRSKRVARQLESIRVTGDATRVTQIRLSLDEGEWHQIDLDNEHSSQ